MAEAIEDDDDSPLTVGDFHNVAQKQILNAVFATLAESKMPWNLVEPFLDRYLDDAPGIARRKGGGGASRCISMISPTFSETNGFVPDSNSKSTMPTV